MKPVSFPQANAKFGPPEGMSEEQVSSVDVFGGKIQGGHLDGSNIIITCWEPTDEELTQILVDRKIYFSILSLGDTPILPPHCITTNFQDACRVGQLG